MKNVFFGLFCALLLVACGTTREYYTPPQNIADINPSSKLPGSIVNVNNNIAVLNDGKILSYFGTQDLKVPKGYHALNIYQNEVLLANEAGFLTLLDRHTGEQLWSQDLRIEVVSASKQGNLIAAVLANNSLILIDLNEGPLFVEPLSPIYTVSDPIASPVFLDTIIVYPSLDGRLLIYSKKLRGIARDIVISSNDSFNNVIFLKISTSSMVAATDKKVIVVSANQEYSKDLEIKQVLADDKNIFILTIDGRVIKTDYQLRVVATKKYKFALFAYACIYKGEIYIFENTGYLFKLDLNLQNSVVKELDAASKLGFMENGKLYFENYIVNLK